MREIDNQLPEGQEEGDLVAYYLLFAKTEQPSEVKGWLWDELPTDRSRLQGEKKEFFAALSPRLEESRSQ